MLRPQDILVALKLVATDERRWTLEALATDLDMSASGALKSIVRAGKCGLVDPKARRAIRPALLEFLIHGVRYVFPAERGRRTRGVPTGPSAEPLARRLASTESSPLVWPHAQGDVRGESVTPLCANVPTAALRDPELYALLATVDGIRLGGARVREVAASVLTERLER